MSAAPVSPLSAEQLLDLQRLRIKLTPMTPEQAMKEWHVLGPFLEKAIPYAAGRLDLEDVKTMVKNRRMWLFVVWDPEERHIYSVLGCEKRKSPRKRIFSISLCGGEEIEMWIHLYPMLRDAAVDMGCQQIEVTGRPGWWKIMQRVAVNPVPLSVSIVEELSDGRNADD